MDTVSVVCRSAEARHRDLLVFLSRSRMNSSTGLSTPFTRFFFVFFFFFQHFSPSRRCHVKTKPRLGRAWFEIHRTRSWMTSNWWSGSNWFKLLDTRAVFSRKLLREIDVDEQQHAGFRTLSFDIIYRIILDVLRWGAIYLLRQSYGLWFSKMFAIRNVFQVSNRKFLQPSSSMEFSSIEIRYWIEEQNLREIQQVSRVVY